MLCGSTLEAILIVSLEKRLSENFLKDSLENKIKKQNVQRFMLALINKLFH